MGVFDTITDPLGIKKKARKELGVEKYHKKALDPFGHIEKLEDKAKDALGYDFEKYNFGAMWDQLKSDPWRAFVGAIDPAQTKVWNELTGKDLDPIISQMGGPTKQRYVDYLEQGGDPKAAKKAMQAHQIAATIASIYAGGALGAMVGPMMGAGAGAATGATTGALTSAIPAGATFAGGLSGTGALMTAAINTAAAEADDEFQPELRISRPPMPGSLRMPGIGSPRGYFAEGGLAAASVPRPMNRRRYA